jgi:hypothetical protein
LLDERLRLPLEEAKKARAILHTSTEVLRATIERVVLMARGYSPDPA